MEVLLMADVKDVGAEGDVVRVAEGFARNYLLPKKLAAPVNETTRRRLAKLRQAREEENRVKLAAARELAGRLGGVSCTIPVKVGEGEKMYGSVTSADLADALKAQGVELDRHLIVLEAPIKELGVFNVPIRLHPDVEATVKVWVVEE